LRNDVVESVGCALISLCLAAFHGMLAVLELDLRDLTRLRRWVRRSRVRVLRILVIVEPRAWRISLPSYLSPPRSLATHSPRSGVRGTG